MKVLFIAPYMTNSNIPLLSQCKAGFGYMTYDIASCVAEKLSVDTILYNYRYGSFNLDNIHFIGGSWSKFIRNLLKCSSPFLPLKLYCKYHMRMRTFIRISYGWLISGFYREVIKNGHYDVVHIHGCGFINEFFINICKQQNIPFVVTLHGLNSFSDSVKLERAGKKYEKDFLETTLKKKYNMTVIASGIKRTILNYFNVKKADNIHVVNNSFAFSDDYSNVNVRNKYGIPKEAKLVLYVGNISSNKNQEQMIRAFTLLPYRWKQQVYILFLGRNNEPGYTIDSIIEDTGYKEHLILCGNIDKSKISSYYQEADAVALLSKAEGFGLSLIEGMHFGLPCMTFTDLDAFNDIYVEDAVIAIPNREDKTVVKSLIEMLSLKWSKETIKKYSTRFESASMADCYINVYKKINYEYNEFV